LISNILLILFHSQRTVYLLLALNALSLGIGLPSCFSFLANSTKFENRGRISSIIQFLIFISVLIIFVFIDTYMLNLNQIMILGLGIRVSTLVPLIFDSFEKEYSRNISWNSILKSKQIIFLLIPWVFCSISNGILIFFDKSLEASPELNYVNYIGKYILLIGTSISGLLSGFLADRSGRKQPLILGFVALGISYAFVGVSTSIPNLLIMIILSSIGWGFITVIVQWVVFGDLAPQGGEEKYYALALSIYPIFEAFFQFLNGILNIDISPNVVALFVSVIMFISLIPLIHISETLPDNLIKDRRFKTYIEKVFKILEESNES
jgi:MFS family permease